MERISHGYDQEACPPEHLLKPDERDKEWVARVVKRAGTLYRDNQEIPEKRITVGGPT